MIAETDSFASMPACRLSLARVLCHFSRHIVNEYSTLVTSSRFIEKVHTSSTTAFKDIHRDTGSDFSRKTNNGCAVCFDRCKLSDNVCATTTFSSWVFSRQKEAQLMFSTPLFDRNQPTCLTLNSKILLMANYFCIARRCSRLIQ